MAIAFDAVSAVATEATSPSWTHTPVGTPRGVFVYVDTEFVGTDLVTGVTYGGVAMTEVAGSPVLKPASEVAATHCFFLGASIPTGPQTVAVTSSTQNAWGRCVTVTAAADVEVVDTTTVTADTGANPSGTLSLGGRTCYAIMGGMGGVADVASVTPVAGWTSRDEYDFGAFVVFMYTKDATSSADITFSLTMGTDDINMIGVAVSEIVGSTYTLTLNHATFSLAGSVALVDLSATMANGSFTLTGQAATLTLGGSPITTPGLTPDPNTEQNEFIIWRNRRRRLR